MAVQTLRTGESLAGSATLPELVAQAAHDLNNHLATVLGKAEISLMVQDPERWRRNLGDILEAGQKARHLVADLQRLLLWSQPQADPVPAGEVFNLVMRLLARRCGHGGVKLVTAAAGVNLPGPAASRLALGLWALMAEALERRCGEEAAWSLGPCESLGAGEWGIEVLLPGVNWDPETRAGVERAGRIGERPEGWLGETLANLDPLGGRLRFGKETVQIVFENRPR